MTPVVISFSAFPPSFVDNGKLPPIYKALLGFAVSVQAGGMR